MEMQIWGRETNYTSLTNQIYTFCTLYKKIRSRPAQGRIQGGAIGAILLSLKYRIPYLL